MSSPGYPSSEELAKELGGEEVEGRVCDIVQESDDTSLARTRSRGTSLGFSDTDVSGNNWGLDRVGRQIERERERKIYGQNGKRIGNRLRGYTAVLTIGRSLVSNRNLD